MKAERPSSRGFRGIVGIAIVSMVGFSAICLHQLLKESKPEAPQQSSKAHDGPPSLESGRIMKPPSHRHNSYEARLNTALADGSPTERSMNYGKIFSDWLKADPEGALAYLQKLPRGETYTQTLFMALPQIAQTDPERAVKLAATMAQKKEELPVFSSLFAGIAEKDPATGIKLLGLAPADARENALRAIASTWATQDLAGSMAWANSLADPSEKITALQSSISSVIPDDPAQAIALAIANLPEDARQETIDKALRAAQADDPESASQWLSQFSDALPAALVPEAARSLAMSSPEDALKWLGEIPAGDQHNVALLAMTRAWSANDPAYAGRMVASNLSPEDQSLAALTLSRAWAAADPAAAIEWSRSLPSSTAADAGLLGAISGWAQNFPEAATQWAAALPNDDGRRFPALEASLSYWVLSDPTGAKRFLESLPASEREQARRLFPPEKPVG